MRDAHEFVLPNSVSGVTSRLNHGKSIVMHVRLANEDFINNFYVPDEGKMVYE